MKSIEEFKKMKEELLQEIERLESEAMESNLNRKLRLFFEAEGMKKAVSIIERKIREILK